MTTPVFIVGYRNPGDIARCLAALSASTDQDFSVLICENGGDEPFRELTALLSGHSSPDLPRGTPWSGTLPAGQQVTCVSTGQNLGYAGALNRLLAQLNGREWEHLWILNPDTVPEPEALTRLLDKARDKNYGLVGSRIQFAGTETVQMYGVHWRRWMGRGLSLGLGAHADTPVDESSVERDIDFVSGASMLVSREFVDAVGPLRDDYFLYFEDVDWCLRRGAFRLGYAHQSVVQHQHGSTIGSNTDARLRSALSVYLTERNRILLTRRFFPWCLPTVVPIGLAFVVRYLIQRAPQAFRVGLHGWLDGIRGRSGPPPARYLP